MGQKPPPGLGLVTWASDNEPEFLVSISQAGSMHIPQVAQHVEQGVTESCPAAPPGAVLMDLKTVTGKRKQIYRERRPKDVYRRADLHRTQPELPRRGPS